MVKEDVPCSGAGYTAGAIGSGPVRLSLKPPCSVQSAGRGEETVRGRPQRGRDPSRGRPGKPAGWPQPAHSAADSKGASKMDGSNLLFIVMPIVIPICRFTGAA